MLISWDKASFYIGLLGLGLSLLVMTAAASQAAPIKLNRTGLCLKPGSNYYQQTKEFMPYKTMEECLRAGG